MAGRGEELLDGVVGVCWAEQGCNFTIRGIELVAASASLSGDTNN